MVLVVPVVRLESTECHFNYALHVSVYLEVCHSHYTDGETNCHLLSEMANHCNAIQGNSIC